MSKIILINGSGGAGKNTSSELLYTKIEKSAWIDIDSLVKVNPWKYDDKLRALGAQNVSVMVKSFSEQGYEYVVVSGGFDKPKTVELLEHLLTGTDYQIQYFWLEADKNVRDERRIHRARDAADTPEHLDFVDTLLFEPGKINFKKGTYHRIDTSSKTKDEVVNEILSRI